MPILVLLSPLTMPNPLLVAEYLKSSASVYTDIDFVRDADGVYDLDFDAETKDFALIDGLESSLLISLFSDRRAAADEIGDPLLRRGWIGDLVSDVPDDKHGSGIWLYDQRKLTHETTIGVRLEAERALRWMQEDGIVSAVNVVATPEPASRAIRLSVTLGMPSGGTSTRAYLVTTATAERSLTNQSA